VRFIQKYLEKLAPLFEKGGKLEKFYYLYEAIDSFLFTTNKNTLHAPYIRDHIDIKRYMSLVVIALIPAIIMGAYNTGYQSFYARGIEAGFFQCLLSGFLIILPIIIVSYTVGGFWEVLFALIRKHEISEGFFVTGILFVLVLPPTIPLWQVAVGITFGVVIAKEVFGGTGMNILNPALTARAFVFFAYPSKISGDKVWIAVDLVKDKLIDGFSGATPLLVASKTLSGQSAITAVESAGFTFKNLFLGLHPGSIGETSTLAILLGAVFLIITGVGSWRIMLAVIMGGTTTALIINILAGQNISGMLSLPAQWHLVMGGFAFGTVFMATDPVSAASTNTGKWIYGIAIGVIAILIRTFNPAYPEGMMLAILFMNVFAPLIDYYLVKANIRRRLTRA
jgi:Na+-transporting NADH:ubiquinone oxidoreductase subunit B